MVNSKLVLRRNIYNIFTKKYGLHIQKDATNYLVELLEDEDDYNEKMEKIIKAYKKRYNGKQQPVLQLLFLLMLK